MTRLTPLACLLVALIAGSALPAAADGRFALVIGNAAYRSVPALANPGNDAELMARTLGAAGFEVSVARDLDRAAMRRAVERFAETLRTAPPGAIALFYFAGHGVRSDGFNHLLPIGVEIRGEADIAAEAVAAEWVMEQIAVPGVTTVLVLDACRDNPFDGRGPGTIAELGDGLARMTAGEGMLIAYATGPGAVALDGAGRNSPYAEALADALAIPGLDLETAFAIVKEDVLAATAGFQEPWDTSSLPRAVVLKPGTAPAPLLTVSVTFRAGRFGGGHVAACNRVYSYAPVRVPPGAQGARRVSALDARHGVALDLTARPGAGGTELTIAPVSGAETGRSVVVRVEDIPLGRERPVFTRSRHPDLFGCGSMTVHLSRSP